MLQICKRENAETRGGKKKAGSRNLSQQKRHAFPFSGPRVFSCVNGSARGCRSHPKDRYGFIQKKQIWLVSGRLPKAPASRSI